MTFNGVGPIYIQIHDYFERLIKTGVLKGGFAMPSVRDFAMANGVNPNTVVRAYDMLLKEGMISSIPKKGFYVATANDKDTNKIKEVLGGLLKEGYTLEDIQKCLDEISGKEGK